MTAAGLRRRVALRICPELATELFMARSMKRVWQDLYKQERTKNRLVSTAQRHVEHYRTCGCLGDSDRCCDPTCCVKETS